MRISTVILGSIALSASIANGQESPDTTVADSSGTVTREDIEKMPVRYANPVGNVYSYGEAGEQIIFTPIIHYKKRKCPACGRG